MTAATATHVTPCSPPYDPERSSVIALERFILATRDSGYRGTAAAIAELIDNALQAGARTIRVQVDEEDGPLPLRVRVQDDGEGMDGETLREALRFGGSSRFDDRAGLGRYGMGLPNGSLSQARRLEVYSWRGRAPLHAWLDLDEIAAGRQRVVPEPATAPVVETVSPMGPHGTLIVWRRCDRLDLRRPSALARRLHQHLARVFRYFLWDGATIEVNGEAVTPFDPLYLRGDGRAATARLYGEALVYDVDCELPDGRRAAGRISVTLCELPVAAWHGLSNDEKRALGIAKGAGASVIRAGREIDHGWLLFGDKRRENYDDWWRCEIRFEPSLDELFGVTHTKQQVTPSDALRRILERDLEAAARALNGRVRAAHEALAQRARFVTSERRAGIVERRMEPLPPPTPFERAAADRLTARHPEIDVSPAASMRYQIAVDTLDTTDLFDLLRGDGALVVVLNAAHPFYTELYQPLALSARPEDERTRSQLDLVLLAAARAEASAAPDERGLHARLRRHWSDVLAEFLKEQRDGEP